MEYRGFRISEVMCEPFAYRDVPGRGTEYIRPRNTGGVGGLVDAIDAHLRPSSVAIVRLALDDRAAAIAAGEWDVIRSQRKGA